MADSATNQAIENFLGNLFLEIAEAAKNPGSVIFHAAIEAEPVQIVQEAAARKPRKSVSFETHTEVLCKSAINQQVQLRIHKRHEGAYLVDDGDLEDVRKLVLAGAL